MRRYLVRLSDRQIKHLADLLAYDVTKNPDIYAGDEHLDYLPAMFHSLINPLEPTDDMREPMLNDFADSLTD